MRHKLCHLELARTYTLYSSGKFDRLFICLQHETRANKHPIMLIHNIAVAVPYCCWSACAFAFVIFYAAKSIHSHTQRERDNDRMKQANARSKHTTCKSTRNHFKCIAYAHTHIYSSTFELYSYHVDVEYIFAPLWYYECLNSFLSLKNKIIVAIKSFMYEMPNGNAWKM